MANKTTLGEELIEALREARAHAQGKANAARVTRVDAPAHQSRANDTATPEPPSDQSPTPRCSRDRP